jgi:hypothetical protein
MWIVMGMWLVGCSGFDQIAQPIEGDQPITFEKDKRGHIVKAIIPEEHHIVLTRGVMDSYTVDQDHAQVLLHCKRKYTSEEMAAIRESSSGRNHSWYTGCTTLTAPVLAKDSSKVEKVAGIAMAAAVGVGLHRVGQGLRDSGTTVNQEGGGAQSDASAQGGSAKNMTNSSNKTFNVKPQTNINSGNKIITK